jgi:hypothetical protein
VVQFDLERLGPTGFQDFAAALLIAEFGVGVQAMGAGRDGGRDLYFRGQLVWAGSEDTPGEVWDGYTVFQVKHRALVGNRRESDVAWLWGQIRDELEAWGNPASDRDPVPNYLVFVTDVALTPFPGSGGHDVIHKSIDQYLNDLADDSRDLDDGAARKARLRRLSGIRKYRMLDANQLSPMLAGQPGVRRAFPAFLTPGDVLAALADYTDSLPLDQLVPGLRAHARTALISDGLTYFDQAGSAEGTGTPVHEVVVDLPVSVPTGDSKAAQATVIDYVLRRGEHVLRPSVTIDKTLRHLVISGAPGNGKTTISKFLVQAFRAAFLAEAENLGEQHQEIITGTGDALTRLGLELPHHRRWPIMVDLAQHAQDESVTDDSTMLRYIAERVSRRSDLGSVTPSVLKSWLKQWPWLVVFDGLDEVTEPASRKRVIERILEFAADAEADDSDVLIVVTTRPTGYVEEIEPRLFERIDLDSLSPAEALVYGQLATKVRLRGDLDRLDRIQGQFERAVHDDAMANLLRTPLQVLIITIILESAGHLAPDRFSLFWTYYETVFARERAKATIGLQRILREHGHEIQHLHERIGFELQTQSETRGGSAAALPPDRLREITWELLEDAGFDPGGRDSGLLTNILTAATHRLVLLTPRPDSGYGFDVRSLQELMAAKRLISGPLESTLNALRDAAPSPHWRNTWIFAAGGLFYDARPYQHEAVVALVENLDEDAPFRLGAVIPLGPRLALDLIDDGMARTKPLLRDRLARLGLGILRQPTTSDWIAVARVIIRFADSGEDQRALVSDELRSALSGTPVARQTAARLQGLVQTVSSQIEARADTRGLYAVRGNGTPPDGTDVDPLQLFADDLATSTVPADVDDVLTAAVEAIRGVISGAPVAAHWPEAVRRALDEPAAAQALAAALTHLSGHEPLLIKWLRGEVLEPQFRLAVGESLRDRLT